MTATIQPPGPVSIRPDSDTQTTQGLPYFIGISAETAGAQGLSMSLIEVPPGAVSETHVHVGYETAIYVLSGRVETRYGRNLEHSVITAAGEFLYVPPDLPHQAINLSETEPARAIVARNDARERENVQVYTPPGA